MLVIIVLIFPICYLLIFETISSTNQAKVVILNKCKDHHRHNNQAHLPTKELEYLKLNIDGVISKNIDVAKSFIEGAIDTEALTL